MSDKRVSGSGNFISEVDMSATALSEAAKWADQLMDAEWKGRADREKSVRYRLAKKIGVAESYLFRLKYKTDEMSDVRGSVYRALMLARHAYGLVCEAGEEAYAYEKELADARNSKVAGMAAALAGPQNERAMT